MNVAKNGTWYVANVGLDWMFIFVLFFKYIYEVYLILIEFLKPVGGKFIFFMILRMLDIMQLYKLQKFVLAIA